MKNYITLVASIFILTFFTTKSVAQTVKAATMCKMYLEDTMRVNATVAEAMRWCELTPPTVQCDDGKIYKLNSFQVSYLQMKPFMSRDFGIAEGGFPIMAREAVKKGKPGDTIILKEVTYTDSTGIKKLPVISVKFN